MKGVKNCHVFGVDSIVLQESPMVRVFIANADHDLWKNCPTGVFSVGFHPHHCDIEIECIAGAIANVQPYSSLMGDTFHRFVFDSVLRGGEGGFRDDNYWDLFRPVLKYGHAGKKFQMAAEELHSVFVPKGETAAWIVREGLEDPHFRPICYSNANLSLWTACGLYLPMPEDAISQAIARYGLK